MNQTHLLGLLALLSSLSATVVTQQKNEAVHPVKKRIPMGS